MPSVFVPFLQNGGAVRVPGARSARGPFADSAAASSAFSALVPNPVAPGGCVHPIAGAAKPVVTLKKDGDRVIQIHIQCSCGQVVELDCAY